MSHKANDDFVAWASETFGELQEAGVLSDEEIAYIKRLMTGEKEHDFETLGAVLSSLESRLPDRPTYEGEIF